MEEFEIRELIKSAHKVYRKAGFYPFSPVIAKNVSMNAALIFCVIVSQEHYHITFRTDKYMKKERYFTVESKFIEEQTGLSAHQRRNGTELLIERGFIQKKHTFNNKSSFKIDWNEVEESMEKWNSK
jgi:hypothetical protein